MRASTVVRTFGFGICALWSISAAAQEQNAEGKVEGQVDATANVALAPPPPPPEPAKETVTVTTTKRVIAPAVITTAGEAADHDRFVGRFAVGYFGITQLPIGTQTGTNGLTRQTVNAPVIGARYWFQREIGIDAGIGFGLTSGSSDVTAGGTTVSTDAPSAFGLAFHAGVPFALVHGQHYSFEAIPEATVGFTSGTVKVPGAADIDRSGFRLDIGGRVGAEIHFGFIGVPELALEGSVGLYFRRDAYKWKQGDTSASAGATSLSTTVQSDPWALFVNNISALYYF